MESARHGETKENSSKNDPNHRSAGNEHDGPNTYGNIP